MVYLEKKPSVPLRGMLRSLWYVRAPDAPAARERVLPDGCVQVVISLASETLTECGEDGSTRPMPGAIVVGTRMVYEFLDTRDYAELVGFVIRPGGLGPWLRQPAADFFEQSVALDAVWAPAGLRERLREAGTPEEKLNVADAMLCESLRGRAVARADAVRGAIIGLRSGSVRETAKGLGMSERRLHQVFRQDVGLSPKQWARVTRFQRALTELHRGTEMRWDELALDCGYYDQAHFSKDFRGFSGIDPTTYAARVGRWKNHVEAG